MVSPLERIINGNVHQVQKGAAGRRYTALHAAKAGTVARKHKSGRTELEQYIKWLEREPSPGLPRKSGVWVGAYPTREAATKALERLTDREITDEYNLTFRQIYEALAARAQPEDRLQRHGRIRSRIQALQQSLRPAISQTANGRFQAIITAQEEAGKSKSACEKLVQLFGQLSKWAIREGIATTNYAQFVTVLARQSPTKRHLQRSRYRPFNHRNYQRRKLY